jgi:hypothetical protein
LNEESKLALFPFCEIILYAPALEHDAVFATNAMAVLPSLHHRQPTRLEPSPFIIQL